jgi:hypothetical protein
MALALRPVHDLSFFLSFFLISAPAEEKVEEQLPGKRLTQQETWRWSERHACGRATQQHHVADALLTGIMGKYANGKVRRDLHTAWQGLAEHFRPSTRQTEEMIDIL